MDKITEAIEKILALPPGSDREQNLRELVALLDQDRLDLHRQISNLTTAYAIAISEKNEILRESRRIGRRARKSA